MIDFRYVAGSDDDINVGSQAARLRHYPRGGRRIGDGDHYHAALADAGLLQNFPASSAAEKNRLTSSFGATPQTPGHFQNPGWNADFFADSGSLSAFTA